MFLASYVGIHILREATMAILLVDGVFQFAHHLQTSCMCWSQPCMLHTLVTSWAWL